MSTKYLQEKLDILDSLINFQKAVTEELRIAQLGLNALYLLSREWDLYNLADLNKDVADLIVKLNGFIYRHKYVPEDFNYLTLLIKLNSFKAKVRIHNILGYRIEKLEKPLEELEQYIQKYMNTTMIKIDAENLKKNANGMKYYLQYVKSSSEYAVKVITSKKLEDYNVKHLVDELVKIQSEMVILVDDFIQNEYLDQHEQLQKLSEIQILIDMYMQIINFFNVMGKLNALEYDDMERAKLAINSCFGIIDLTGMIQGQCKNA
ncbi:MAG: hypothetical protein QW578_08650 [Thermoplasmatales archaeon]